MVRAGCDVGSASEAQAVGLSGASLGARGNARLDVSQQLGLFISAKTAEAQACWAWLTFLSEQEEAVILLPARRDIAASDAWRQRVGTETADAWRQLLEREITTATGWERGSASFALYWLEEAFDEVLGGSPAAMALAGAQAKASGLADCLEASGESEEAWRGCIRQIDPEAVVP